MDDDQLRKSALEYHRLPTPGKISIAPTKGLTNQRDLALAYSPGRRLRLPRDQATIRRKRRASPRGRISSAS